jgi:hypothetical protein
MPIFATCHVGYQVLSIRQHFPWPQDTRRASCAHSGIAAYKTCMRVHTVATARQDLFIRHLYNCCNFCWRNLCLLCTKPCSCVLERIDGCDELPCANCVVRLRVSCMSYSSERHIESALTTCMPLLASASWATRY